MATGSIILPMLAAVPSLTVPPALSFGTTTLQPYWIFDSLITDEILYWTFPVPTDFSAATTLRIFWSNSTTATGNAVWGAQFAAITPNSDTNDMTATLAGALASAVTVTDAGVGTRRLQMAEMDISSGVDGAVAEDWLLLQLFHDVSADTIAEDVHLYGLTFEYTTT